MTTSPTAAGRVVFVGAVHEARPALAALLGSRLVKVAAVVTPTAQGARKLAGAVDLARLARPARVPALRIDDVNAPDAVARVRALAPDLLVVAGWTRLIGRPLLAVPSRGCVGFHASLLPRHRGHAPVNWAILRGETITGNTMMMLDPGADTGDIVDQRVVTITPEDTCRTVYARIALAGAEMLVTHLPALLAGTARRRPQDPAAGEVLPRRTPAMGITDWDRPSREVHDWVRALTAPYPGAFSTMDGRQVMLWRTRSPRASQPTGDPGTVLAVEPDGVRVATRAGSVVVSRMSGRGERPGPAQRWCRLEGIDPGRRFDAVPPAVSRWARGEGPCAEMVPV